MDPSPPPSPQAFSGTATPLAYNDDLFGSHTQSPGEYPYLTSKFAHVEDDHSDLGESSGQEQTREERVSKELVLRHMKGKAKEWASIVERHKPLNLLDLPVDILKGIIDQIPHTNDLTNLARTNSAFHNLTMSAIYRRFDIVWPENIPHEEPRTGVDALTYGLATLVMAEEVFGEGPHQRSFSHMNPHRSNSAPGKLNKGLGRLAAPENPFPIPKRRKGNHYAQFTKKFSLGNGPAELIKEYLIDKEAGKLLNTLVALAVARMRNLEIFVWDMPTGVMRDVWLALSSLADRNDGHECRLEQVWVRWHPNRLSDRRDATPPPPINLTNLPIPSNHALGAIVQPEYPTFSVIPALKSLSVLDIDELLYLDEMSILVGRSQHCLRELRVGIARHARGLDWVTPWDGEGVEQVDYSTTSPMASSIGRKRLGGVLGVLVGRVYNIRQNALLAAQRARAAQSLGKPSVAKVGPTQVESQNRTTAEQSLEEQAAGEVHVPSAPTQAQPLTNGTHPQVEDEDPKQVPLSSPGGIASMLNPKANSILEDSSPTPYVPPLASRRRRLKLPEKRSEPVLSGKLKLETLELERVPLSVSVLLKAFDWTMLTTLTLLHCNNHEQLWKALRHTYSPKINSNNQAAPSIPGSIKSYKVSGSIFARSEYRLNLRKIHTDTVSPALIHFLRETLAPNTLEVLFLRSCRSYDSTVTLEAIYRGPIRRHRASLRKLMIDSSDRDPDNPEPTSDRWRIWMLNREVLTFITSSRMSALRELAVTLSYADWHCFLQRLPMIPHIRALYIPHLADHAHGNNIDEATCKELALQIVDILTLRPEIELCYMGILKKCYEILENKPGFEDSLHDHLDAATVAQAVQNGLPNDPINLTDDEDDDATDEDDDTDGLDGAADEPDDFESSEDGHYDSEDDSDFNEEESKAPKLRIREILFYDDRVAIFKARHGRI